jgi:hypothetical protein
MDLHKVAEMPTVIQNIHESCYRSYAVVHWMQDMLDKGVPGPVVADLSRELVQQANKWAWDKTHPISTEVPHVQNPGEPGLRAVQDG